MSSHRSCAPILTRSGFVALALGGSFCVMLAARAADETPLVTFGGRPPPVAAPVAVPDWSPPVIGAPVEADLPQTPIPQPSEVHPPLAAPAPPSAPSLSERQRAGARAPHTAGNAEQSTAAAADQASAQPVPAPAIAIEDSAQGSEQIGAAQRAQAPAPLRFIVRGNRSLPLETIRAALHPFVLGEAAPQQLQAASAALQSAYERAGRAWVRVHTVGHAAPGAPVVFEVAEAKLRSFHLVPLGVEAIAAVKLTPGSLAGPLQLRLSRLLHAVPGQ